MDKRMDKARLFPLYCRWRISAACEKKKNKSCVGLTISYVGNNVSYLGIIISYVGDTISYVLMSCSESKPKLVWGCWISGC